MKPFFPQTFIPLTLPLLLALAAAPLCAQTTMGSTSPDPSAELHVQSTTRGLLPPRLTTAQRNAIANPAAGLLIFNTTLNCVEMNIGTPATPAWGCINTTNTATAASATPTVCINTTITPITHTTTGATGIGTATGLPSGVTASWASNTVTISGRPTVAGTFNYSVPLTGGLGSAQATGTITVQTNTASAASSTPTVNVATAITAITHTTTVATGIGTPSGLPSGVTASWASNTITVSGTPSGSGVFNYSIPLSGGCGIVNATGTIRVAPNECGAWLSSTTWKTFGCYNMGYSQGKTQYAQDWQNNGAYYQWGRRAIAAPAPTGSDLSAANAGGISGWNTTNAANGAWSDGTKTSNDPCPSGFRIPTKAQWEAVANTTWNPVRSFLGTWTNSATNYSFGLRIGSGNSGLYLPAAGFRQGNTGSIPNNGQLLQRGADGLYWSSTEDGNSYAWYFTFSNTSCCGVGITERNQGLSVRCITQ